ncbi:hypothetical protein OIE40_00290 [Micropruina sp. KQZ13P-5]|nr:hypothetical protein [Micropruina sp. KQZ13P-5]MCW3156453.1 hypothetical protein [Micropruina sp. KQZ13P-5]
MEPVEGVEVGADGVAAEPSGGVVAEAGEADVGGGVAGEAGEQVGDPVGLVPGEHERLQVGVGELAQVAGVVLDGLLGVGVEEFGPSAADGVFGELGVAEPAADAGDPVAVGEAGQRHRRLEAEPFTQRHGPHPQHGQLGGLPGAVAVLERGG